MMTLQEQLHTLSERILALDGVTQQAHRFGGTEFNVGKIEIGHFHRNGMVDIPFTRQLREHLVATNEAELHHLLDESGWISFYLNRTGTVEDAARLFALSYLQKTIKRNRDLSNEQIKVWLSELSFSDEINQVILGLRGLSQD